MKHSILFICLGNICRSAAAEGIMKHLVEKKHLEDSFFIDSAGTSGWHVGELPDRRMRSHGADHGYDFSSRSRQFEREDFDRFDHIVVMDNENYHDIMSLARNDDDKQKVSRMVDYTRHHPTMHSVPDPYYGGDRGFELVIELLEDGCEGLLEVLTGNQSYRNSH